MPERNNAAENLPFLDAFSLPQVGQVNKVNVLPAPLLHLIRPHVSAWSAGTRLSLWLLSHRPGAMAIPASPPNSLPSSLPCPGQPVQV